MTEIEAVENAKKIFEKNKVFRWHEITIHFGPNTNYSTTFLIMLGYNNRDMKL